ncbi:Ribosomal protein S30 [Artemisia annua]|uniref:40S ribosomal protein S30 n=1 Tax=Artemisia annua TaxID=35608 RepID=A0A2U1LXR4_ARTAN|nr:Ribosomal protein S30 [Artemisia annua]
MTQVPCSRLNPIYAQSHSIVSFIIHQKAFFGKRTRGKVHGSLARAGKVRGQTPKVAKQDKKKQPHRRAHKCIQYLCHSV